MGAGALMGKTPMGDFDARDLDNGRSPWDRRFNQASFEDDAWGDPGVVGIVAAIAIVLLIVGVGAWLDGCGCLVGAVDLLRGDR